MASRGKKKIYRHLSARATGISRLNARPLWRKMKFVISHQPASNFALLFIIMPRPDFSPRPRFSFHRDKLAKFLLYLLLPCFLPFLVLDRGIQQLSRRRKRLRERDQSSKRKREKTSTSSRRFLLLLSREVYGLGRVNWRESFVWKFSGRFLREVYLRDCLWGEANFATLLFLIGGIYQADYRKGVGVFDCSIFLYWFIGRLCLSLSQKFVINFKICSNLGKGRVVENLREF